MKSACVTVLPSLPVALPVACGVESADALAPRRLLSEPTALSAADAAMGIIVSDPHAEMSGCRGRVHCARRDLLGGRVVLARRAGIAAECHGTVAPLGERARRRAGADIDGEAGETQLTAFERGVEQVLLAAEERTRRIVLGDDRGADAVVRKRDPDVDVAEAGGLEAQAHLAATTEGRHAHRFDDAFGPRADAGIGPASRRGGAVGRDAERTRRIASARGRAHR